MGDFNIRRISNSDDRNQMYRKALQDINAFELMLKENMFDTSPPKIGAEQELCIVGKDMLPNTVALDALGNITDQHFTNELALYNMEINLDPLELREDCFSLMEKDLIRFLNYNSSILAQYDSHQVLTGILPTLQYEHLNFKNITPIKRYKTLSDELTHIRGENFQIHVQGIDEILMSLDSVLFEACNTSFQLHLQIHPNEFVHHYNWAQLISGPVLAACVNSPLLFGNELWAETRIAIFKQSLDTRSSYKHLRKKLPRVYYGDSWLENSPCNLWKNDIMRFPLLLTADGLEDSIETLNKGNIPKLKGIRLHNGTTYTWNRMCYGYSDSKPHLRIECRYIPSGPTAIDEMANMAFWIGLMNNRPEEKFWRNIKFKLAKDNFVKAARTGLRSVLYWNGSYIPAKELILKELIPLAYEGLMKVNIGEVEANKYLQVIQSRVESETTGSEWLSRNHRHLSETIGKSRSAGILVKEMITYQSENLPVHQWSDIPTNYVFPSPKKVQDIMSTDIIAIGKNSSLAHAATIMNWKNIHHLPIEDNDGDLIGIITDGIVKRNENSDDYAHLKVSDVMISNPITVEASETIQNITGRMKQNSLSGIPVVLLKKLIGIVTSNDLRTNNT